MISIILAAVAGPNMFVIKEDTRVGAFAMVSACIWIGIFNSIQSVCKERGIIKREHRSGLYISAYMMAHMIYQAVICLAQTVIMFVIYDFWMDFPEKGLMTGSFRIDLFITFFLLTYASAALGLAVSSVVHSPTTAMTIMPFILIVQLIFSGAIFWLEGPMDKLSDVTISKWGMRAVCTDANINSMPSSMLSDQLYIFRQYEPVAKVLDLIPEEMIMEYSSRVTYESIYEYNRDNVKKEWQILGSFIVLYYGISVVSLQFIDRDKR